MKTDRYLEHHGIMGQKWGVRHGPPYPIDHTVMPKGTKLSNISGLGQPEQKWKYTYNPNDSWDTAVYKGPFVAYLTMRGYNYILENSYETTKDLKMPTRAERLKEFKDLYDDKKYNKTVIKECEGIRKILVERRVGTDEEVSAYKNLDLKNIKTDSDWETAYSVFNHAMEASHKYESTREYSKRVESKWDAMVDDNNQGVYNNAHDPVIIFKAQESLKALESKFLTFNEMEESYKKVELELAKEGKMIKW